MASKRAFLWLMIGAAALAAVWLVGRGALLERRSEPARETPPLEDDRAASASGPAEVRPASAPRLASAHAHLRARPMTELTGRVVDEFGRGVAGASVVFYGEDVGFGSAKERTHSDEAGRFVIGASTRSPWSLVISREGFGTRCVWSQGNAPRWNLGDVCLAAEVKLRGVVRDEWGKPIEGATVRRIGMLEHLRDPDSASTNALGEYELHGLASGEVALEVSSTGFQPYFDLSLQIPRVSEWTLDAVLNQRKHVSLRIEEPPPSNAHELRFSVLEPAGSRHVRIRRIRVHFLQGQGGSHKLTFESPSSGPQKDSEWRVWVTETAPYAVAVVLADGREIRLEHVEPKQQTLVLRAPEFPSLRGKVILSDGSPLAGVEVEAAGADTTGSPAVFATTNANGEFHFSKVLCDSAGAVVSLRDRRWSAPPRFARPRAEGALEAVTLEAAPGAWVRIVRAAGTPRAPAMWIVVRDGDYAERILHFPHAAELGTNGTLLFGPLHPGKWFAKPLFLADPSEGNSIPSRLAAEDRLDPLRGLPIELAEGETVELLWNGDVLSR
ncbi:MAG: carboxypeptidase regulatory-like domain-containing protein [Planctomycetes bacterium]|nr:carboxypeptidase regulatory-like domain-containing protein [Planctomycetota bacterium]